MAKKLGIYSVLALLLFSGYVYALSYDEIYRAADGYTDAQFKVYAKSLVGQTVTWTGKVKDVKKKWFSSNYEVSILMRDEMGFHVSFEVPEALALQLKKNGSYTFTGEIEIVVKVFGKPLVSLKDVRFK